MKTDEDKVVPIDDHKVFAISGEAGDRVNFSEFVIANVRLYALRNGMKLTTKAVANYTRNELAIALRKVGWAWVPRAVEWHEDVVAVCLGLAWNCVGLLE